MRNAFAFLFVSVSCLALVSFDPAGSGWTAVRGSATADPAVRHGDAVSLRLEGDGSRDALVRSTPVALAIGKHYELSGWVRTDSLRVRDLVHTCINRS
jgi:hypothetical protein